ncbi:hypothetical protein PGH12_11245 [Chryseobacterium wangxinyae]|uniref:hypothetical protein n=1 Tax=Chryseobacterium sp. CY350 TaxID=2997336 RepID=UPI00226F1747|nr:hypothetical protein [Chryseobacterium sp. CY350]MCY0976355.1 hypothetical protein [Chryseobacterium sp. CY350]WBZ94047.1 hypothetical protein PGH12_11245 [Chryseobacterium sp. CY350]
MQEKYPQKPGLDFILKQAFYYWNRTLLYQLMFSIIYFALFFSSIFFFADYFGIFEFNDELQIALQKGFNEYLQKSQELGKTENAVNFVYSVLGTIIFLYPLNLGFYQIFKKLDLKEPTELSDLFVGYRGLNFFRYMSYFIFWFFFYSLIAQTVILPVIWVMITLFVAPLMFFQNKTIFEGIALNWKALKMYFIEIFVCVIVAFLFKYIGFALFFVGGLLTFPFWNAMIYSLYKSIFEEKN